MKTIIVLNSNYYNQITTLPELFVYTKSETNHWIKLRPNRIKFLVEFSRTFIFGNRSLITIYFFQYGYNIKSNKVCNSHEHSLINVNEHILRLILFYHVDDSIHCTCLLSSGDDQCDHIESLSLFCDHGETIQHNLIELLIKKLKVVWTKSKIDRRLRELKVGRICQIA